MKERRQRVVLWTGAFTLTLLLFIPKGHETPPGGAPSAAFLHVKSGTALVRIAGDVPYPGIYRLDAPGTVEELIRQTAPRLVRILTGDQLLAIPLADGDVVTVTMNRDNGATLARTTMPARERLVLGIPLIPAHMTAADWEALPGIGPALTKRIMTYGRQSGGIHTLDDLLGVDGIGEQSIDKLRPLFK
jgi:competence protein ComEA